MTRSELAASVIQFFCTDIGSVMRRDFFTSSTPKDNSSYLEFGGDYFYPEDYENFNPASFPWTYKYVDKFGGEGHGDSYWPVYEFSLNGVSCHIKFDGYYNSYEGATCDNLIEVEPRQVMRTAWFPV